MGNCLYFVGAVLDQSYAERRQVHTRGVDLAGLCISEIVLALQA